MGLVPPHEVGPGQKRHCPSSAVTPVDQLIVPWLWILDLKQNKDRIDIRKAVFS